MSLSTNDHWLDDRAREMRDSLATIRRLQAELDDAQLWWRPPEGGWSIGQVFGHLVLVDKPYTSIVPEALTRAPRGGKPWKPSLIGRLVRHAVDPKSERRYRTGRGFQPGAQPRANAIADYIAIREELLRLVEQAKGVDLNRTRVRSPVSRFVRYNLGDAFLILVRHTQRHLQQAERVRSHAHFPKRTGTS